MNSFVLKLFAASFMLIDHIGILFFPEIMIFRILGRISFPIFAFLVVEGFMHTRNIKKYILRIVVFGFISEIPFYMLVSGHILCRENQNLFFTFAIGLVMLWFLSNNVVPMYTNLIVAVGVLLAVLLRTDYSLYGMALINFFYMFRESRIKYIFFVLVSLLYGGVQRAALLSVVPLWFYNGNVGPEFTHKNVIMYGFFIFYPVHMLILFGIKKII